LRRRRWRWCLRLSARTDGKKNNEEQSRRTHRYSFREPTPVAVFFR
jgi:hypothetical protein